MTPSSKYLPAGVLSDMDGVLLDTERLSHMSFESVATRHGFVDEGGRVFGQLLGLNKAGHQAVFADMLPDGIDASRFDADWKEDFMARLEADIPLKAKSAAMLQWLVDNHVAVALVTSSSRDKTLRLMERVDFTKHFNVIVCGDEVENGKPAPDIYLRAAEHLNLHPSDCVAFEDSRNGVCAAHAAGARVIQVVDLQPPSQETTKLADKVVYSLEEAGQYLGWDF